MVNKKFGLFVFVLVLSIFALASYVSASGDPTGASTTFIKTGTAPNDTAGSQQAIAGNVTEVNLYGYSTTRSWQGFYGNVTGTIQLTDANDNVFYNWSVASPRGQVYVTTNNTVQWAYVECFNFTSTGTQALDTAQAGNTSLFGTNLTTLEQQFNITSLDVDGVNETFTLSGAGTHNLFYVGALQFDVGECMNTRVFDSTGKGVDNRFEEVLLYEPQTTSVIFTTLLNDNAAGFDSATHDFETLVLENGHGTDTASTTYYFFVELQ